MTKPLKIVIPTAGFGSRLRPLTWSRPKPLISLAGGTVLDILLNSFRSIPNFDEVEFVIILGSWMGEQIPPYITEHYPDWHVDFAVQPEMKGQSDALWCAREFLHGPMMMSFSDTLLDHDFSFLGEEKAEAVALVKPVPDPRRFGVAEVDAAGRVTRLVEKPQSIENNLAVVGCYYFQEAEDLVGAIETQIERNVALKNEYYLADAINIMLERGLKMRTEKVDAWLDAGTAEALLETNAYFLEHGRDNSITAQVEESVIIPPVHIHPGARVSASVIGPHVSVGEGASIKGSTVKNSIIGPGTHVTHCMLENSLIGHSVTITGQTGKFNLGDNSWAVQ